MIQNTSDTRFILPEGYFTEAQEAYHQFLNLKEQGRQHWEDQKLL